MDEHQTDFVDLDQVLSYYLDEYRTLRKGNQLKICKSFGNHEREMRRNEQVFLSLKDVKNLMVKIIPEKSFSPSVHYPREITVIRSFLYSLVCGDNSGKVSMAEFLAGCNRFGIDNPCPIITKRLSTYGNNEDILKDFTKIAEKFNQSAPLEALVDPEIYTSAEVKGQSFDGLDNKIKVMTYKDFGET